jgi:hypothetical protein
MLGRRNARQSVLDGKPPDAILRHVVLDTYIIVGPQRILDTISVNAYAKSGRVGKKPGRRFPAAHQQCNYVIAGFHSH